MCMPRYALSTLVAVLLVTGCDSTISPDESAGVAARVTVTPSGATITAGETQSFEARVFDLHGDAIAGAVVSWSSSDDDVATVDAIGTATGVDAGSAAITASFAEISGSADLTVEAAPDPTPEPILSTFETDVEGWTKLGDPASTIEHVTESDRSFIRYFEGSQGAHDFFVAPEKFQGDLSAYYGGRLSYDLRVNTLVNPLSQNDYVQLEGGGITIVYRNAAPASTNVWYSFEIDLDIDTAWQVATSFTSNYAIGTMPATAEQIQQVLADVTALRIRADYRHGAEQIDLDNVVIQAEP